MDTKLRGDVAEQAAVLKGLRQGWGVLTPVGDRLPYDVVFDVSGCLVRVQTKQAWYYGPNDCYLVDNRRTKTNRRRMIRSRYSVSDFDFALVYLEDIDLFYVFPVEVFIAYSGQISFVESAKRQRKPRSAQYRVAWDLITLWASSREISMRSPVKFGEASCDGNPEPSSELSSEKV